jgi:hypothetical protein
MNLHWATIKKVEDVPANYICCDEMKSRMSATVGNRLVIDLDFSCKAECVCPCCGRQKVIEATVVAHSHDHRGGTLVERFLLDVEETEVKFGELVKAVLGEEDISNLIASSDEFTQSNWGDTQPVKESRPKRRPRCNGR